MGELMEMVEW